MTAADHDYDLFVSHTAADREWVHGFLLPSLALPPERTVTPEDFVPGRPIVDEVERAIRASRYTVLVFSPAYVGDAWGNFGEQLVSTASVSERRERVVPLVLRPVTLPLRVEFRVSLDCTDERKWNAAAARLRELLRQPERTPSVPVCPYPGMVPYGAKDASLFFGREDDVRRMVAHVRVHRRLFVIGPSGSGKSSLIFAGLVPALLARFHGGPDAWRVVALRPGSRPLDALLEALPGAAHDVAASVDRSLSSSPAAGRLLLIVDQLEELFSQATRDDQRRFLAAAAALASDERCCVAYTLRADFYHELISSSLWPIDESERLDLGPLRGDSLRAAIVQPAAAVGVFLEPALVERLVADAADEPGSLPLVQETLRLLWEHLQQRLLTLSAYERLGHDGRSGLAVALAARADAAFAQLSPSQQAIARRVFLSLVQFGENHADTRRQQPVADLQSPRDDRRDFETTLEHLTRHRLLTRSGALGVAGARVDLAHDVLIRGWPRLRAWLEHDRASLLQHRRLGRAADEWRRSNHDETLLFVGGRLTEAQQFAAAHPNDISADEAEFLAASEARDHVRERTLYMGQAAGGAVGAAVGYGLAFALGFLASNGDARINLPFFSVLTFLFIFPVGQLVGFGIGLGLWFGRRQVGERIAYAALIGGGISALSYALFVQAIAAIMGTTRMSLGHVLAGLFFGVALGLGASLPYTGWQRVMATCGASVLAGLLALAVRGVSWGVGTTIVAGILLGLCTGLGFFVTAVAEQERVVV